MAEDPNDPRTLIIAGVVVVVIGLLFAVWQRSDDESDVGCKITAAGVALVADGLAHGRPTAQIVASSAAGLLAKEACEKAIDSLVSSASAPVELTIQTAGGTGQVDVSRSDLVVRSTRPTTCSDWYLTQSQNQCRQGLIGPPLFDLNPSSPTCDDWEPLSFLTRECFAGAIGPPSTE